MLRVWMVASLILTLSGCHSLFDYEGPKKDPSDMGGIDDIERDILSYDKDAASDMTLPDSFIKGTDHRCWSTGSINPARICYRSIGIEDAVLWQGHCDSVQGSTELSCPGASLERIGQGDRLEAEDESEAYLLEVRGDDRLVLQHPLSQPWSGQVSIRRAFADLQRWEDERGGDLVGENRREVGVCYNDGPFTEPLLIAGSKTSHSTFMQVTVAEGNRHQGRAGGGVVLQLSTPSHGVQILNDYTRLDGLEITGWSNSEIEGSLDSYDGINNQG